MPGPPHETGECNGVPDCGDCMVSYRLGLESMKEKTMSIITNPPGLLSSHAIAAGYTSSSGVALASDAAVDSCACGPREACSECPPDKSARGKAQIVDDLSQAAITLRDAELALQSARENYRAKLDAFNRFVAPVPG